MCVCVGGGEGGGKERERGSERERASEKERAHACVCAREKEIVPNDTLLAGFALHENTCL